MTDSEDHVPGKKSIPNLTVIPGVDPRAAPPVKVKPKDIHAMIVDAMLGDIMSRWPDFPARLHRGVDHAGASLVYEESGGIVRRVATDRVDELIAAYWVTVRRTGVPLGTITAADVRLTRLLWHARSTGRTEPFPILVWRSDPRAALHRVAFDPAPSPAPTPLFDELLGRMTNTAALRAWIGSLFDERSQRQQYVWIYGKGETGKGALVRALKKVLGPVARNGDAPAKGAVSQFWTSGLLGTRLAVFADSDQPDFVTTGLFKSLTGEDDVRVEIKGGAILSLNLAVKFLFTSNEKPSLTGNSFDSRRVVYCSVEEPASRYAGADYEAALGAELADFVSACWRHYLEVTGGNPRAVLASDNSVEVARVAEATEHEAKAFVDGYLCFETGPGGRVVPGKGGKTIFATGREMNEIMIKAGFVREGDRKRLRAYLERVHGIRSEDFYSGGERIWGFRYVKVAFAARDDSGPQAIPVEPAPF